MHIVNIKPIIFVSPSPCNGLGWRISVGTCFGCDSSGFEPRWGMRFCLLHIFRTAGVWRSPPTPHLAPNLRIVELYLCCLLYLHGMLRGEDKPEHDQICKTECTGPGTQVSSPVPQFFPVSNTPPMLLTRISSTVHAVYFQKYTVSLNKTFSFSFIDRKLI
jgi:hypothetical protein